MLNAFEAVAHDNNNGAPSNDLPKLAINPFGLHLDFNRTFRRFSAAEHNPNLGCQRLRLIIESEFSATLSVMGPANHGPGSVPGRCQLQDT